MVVVSAVVVVDVEAVYPVAEGEHELLYVVARCFFVKGLEASCRGRRFYGIQNPYLSFAAV